MYVCMYVRQSCSTTFHALFSVMFISVFVCFCLGLRNHSACDYGLCVCVSVSACCQMGTAQKWKENFSNFKMWGWSQKGEGGVIALCEQKHAQLVERHGIHTMRPSFVCGLGFLPAPSM